MRALRPLRHRDFRLMWTGLAVSLVGDGLWLVALAWQVIELGGGPVDLSLVATLYAVGLVGCMLLGGVLADRVSRRAIMLVADAVRAVAVLVLGGLSVGGALELWQLAVGGLLIGSAEAFFVPAFTALVPQLVPEDELLAANGLEGVVRPVAQQALGPAIGGLLVATAGPGPAMLADAATYLVSVACLSAMRMPRGATASATAPTITVRTEDPLVAVPRRPRRDATREVVGEIRAGLAYVRSERWLWGTILFATVAVLFVSGPVEVLVPFLLRDDAGADASGFGLFLAIYGVGSAIGALAVAARRMPRRYLTAILVMWGLGPLPLAALGWLDALWAMCLLGFVVALVNGGAQVVWGTLLQSRVPDALRGRVSSVDWFVSLALLPISMALAGPAGELVGLAPVFVAAGVVPAVTGMGVLFGLGLRRDELAHPL